MPSARPTPGTATAPISSATAPVPKVRVLVAGLDKDSRGPVEAAVRQALAGRGISEPWTVSLVKVGARWSVILHGPSDSTRSISLTAEDGGLAPAIRRAIGAEAGTAHAPAGTTRAADAPEAPALVVQDSHVCEHCHGTLVVSYETRSAEPKERVPAACPHCWKLNHFEIGAWAAAGQDFRCDKGPTSSSER